MDKMRGNHVIRQMLLKRLPDRRRIDLHIVRVVQADVGRAAFRKAFGHDLFQSGHLSHGGFYLRRLHPVAVDFDHIINAAQHHIVAVFQPFREIPGARLPVCKRLRCLLRQPDISAHIGIPEAQFSFRTVRNRISLFIPDRHDNPGACPADRRYLIGLIQFLVRNDKCRLAHAVKVIHSQLRIIRPDPVSRFGSNDNQLKGGNIPEQMKDRRSTECLGNPIPDKAFLHRGRILRDGIGNHEHRAAVMQHRCADDDGGNEIQR